MEKCSEAVDLTSYTFNHSPSQKNWINNAYNKLSMTHNIEKAECLMNEYMTVTVAWIAMPSILCAASVQV